MTERHSAKEILKVSKCKRTRGSKQLLQHAVLPSLLFSNVSGRAIQGMIDMNTNIIPSMGNPGGLQDARGNHQNKISHCVRSKHSNENDHLDKKFSS